MILNNSIQAVKEVAALDVIGEYVDLKKKGINYLGLCPFHDEKTPSFCVNPVLNAFKCFGCGVGGDTIGFVMSYEKKTFIEAVELIAGFTGIHLETGKRTRRTPRAMVNKKKKVTLFDTIPQSLLFAEEPRKILSNPLTRRFVDTFGADIVAEVIEQYNISIKNNWLTYPQIDVKGLIRTGKSINYQSNGHRDKNTRPVWLHKGLISKGLLPESFKLSQTFTGANLIAKYPSRIVGVVEGQSTMLFMACLSLAARTYKIKDLEYFAQFTWVSTGGSDGIGWKSDLVTDILKGKRTVLFPDAGFYGQWLTDAEIMQDTGLKVAVSDLIERKYTEGLLNKNDDLRDYLEAYTTDIKSLIHLEPNAGPVTLSSKEFAYDRGGTYTGLDFGELVIYSFEMPGKTYCQIVFDKYGQFVTEHEKLHCLQSFFEKSFKPALVDNTPCLIHFPNN